MSINTVHPIIETMVFALGTLGCENPRAGDPNLCDSAEFTFQDRTYCVIFDEDSGNWHLCTEHDWAIIDGPKYQPISVVARYIVENLVESNE